MNKTYLLLGTLFASFSSGMYVMYQIKENQINEIKIQQFELIKESMINSTKSTLANQAKLNELNQETEDKLQEIQNEKDRLNTKLINANARVQFITRELSGITQSTDSTNATMGTSTIEIPRDIQLNLSNLRASIRRDKEALEYCINYSRTLWKEAYNVEPEW